MDTHFLIPDDPDQAHLIHLIQEVVIGPFIQLDTDNTLSKISNQARRGIESNDLPTIQNGNTVT